MIGHTDNAGVAAGSQTVRLLALVTTSMGDCGRPYTNETCAPLIAPEAVGKS